MRYDEYVVYIKRNEEIYVTRSLAAQLTFVGAILAFDLIQPYQIEELNKTSIKKVNIVQLELHTKFYDLMIICTS